MGALPDGVRLEAGRGGLRRLVVTTAQAEAEVYLHGGQITQFQPRGQEPVLFLSNRSSFAPDKPIRGGVPVCFPWFGARKDGRPGPSHGFARLHEWEIGGVELASDGAVEIRLRFASNPATRREWAADFLVDYRLRIGEALALELGVHNPMPQPLRFEEALHTYLAVRDVRAVSVVGLAGGTYLDTVGPLQRKTQGADPMRVTAETDRIYDNSRATCIVHDPGWGRRLVVEKSGSDTTVVWNPWIAKAQALADFGDDEWPAMLCIETCNVREQAVTLAPGGGHTMRAVVRVE